MKKLQLSSGEVSSFCMELSVLLHSGLTPADALMLMAEESQADTKALVTDLGRDVGGGEPLSAAMEHAGAFPAYVCALTRVGEQSGRTEEALAALSDEYESRTALERRLFSALAYPLLLLLFMLVVIGVLLIQVLPVFDRVFASLGSGLTGIAGGLLALGRGLDAALPVLLVVLAAAVCSLLGFAVWPAFRAWILNRWSALRGDRGLAALTAQTQMAQAMAMGLRSGLGAERALEISAGLQRPNSAAAVRCRACQKRLESGEGLASALKESGLLPPAECRMLALGVRTGSGDTVMAEIARRMDSRCAWEIDAAVGRVEPAIVLAASLLVGAILLSVMLPLMNIMAAIG